MQKNPNNNKTLQLETKPKQNPQKQMDHPQDWFSPHVLKPAVIQYTFYEL